MTIEDLRPHPCGVGRPPTPSHHTGIAPVVRAVWVAGRRRTCRAVFPHFPAANRTNVALRSCEHVHVNGCTVHTPCGGSLIPSPSVHIRCGCCVCPSCQVCKVSSVHPIQCCSRTHKGKGKPPTRPESSGWRRLWCCTTVLRREWVSYPTQRLFSKRLMRSSFDRLCMVSASIVGASAIGSGAGAPASAARAAAMFLALRTLSVV